MKIARELIEKLIESNGFKYIGTPTVVVLRNTNHDRRYNADTGDNNCDTVILFDKNNIELLTGRTVPHKKYQAKMVAGTDKANYIQSGHYKYAWVRGLHFGKEAGIQHKPFIINRSKDMELRDDDDYLEVGIVYDDFHGWAPDSAGCITVEGGMEKNAQTGDWAKAHKWFYDTHKEHQYIDAMIFEYEDVVEPLITRIRPGSQGELVKKLQRILGTTPDGDFGPASFMSLVHWQIANNCIGQDKDMKGVAGRYTLNKMGLLDG